MSVLRLVVLSTLALAAGKRAGSSQGFHRGQLEATVSEQALEAKPVTYVVKWPKMAGLLDGEYVEAGTRNAKPMYKQRNGPGAIWHESYLHKPGPKSNFFNNPGWEVIMASVQAWLREGRCSS
eukprot:s4610_g4.t1